MSNYAEIFNNKTKEARSFPVATFLEVIRFTLQTWFADRRKKATKAISVLAPLMEADLKQMAMKENFLDVQVLGHYEFLVVDGDGEMNYDTKSCSCCMFETIGIPCVHALVVAIKMSINIYSLCSPYYIIDSWRDTYKETIYLVGNEDEWVIPDHISDMVVGILIEKNPIGRPKKKKLGSSAIILLVLF
ncbi:uncharacterized protein LOC133815392 [Humulus lupulus]|uniref:uncharacterized protein LOC133815392 n=1 Tax=Humulus lupulus TaxID=3486 RepID=UPI002B404BE1|nr:uncharacterized protein LOC133815392 [Humulus lupulus]